MRLGLAVLAAGLLTLAARPAAAQVYSIDIPGGVKICSAVVPSNWRNDVQVPRAWTKQTCTAWAAQIGASGSNLGCLTDTGIRYDMSGGNWNTCGW